MKTGTENRKKAIILSRRAAFRKAILCSAVATTLSQPAGAAVLEEVFVTAQKRKENLQDTPMSVTAFAGEALDDFRISSFDDVAKLSPSITFAPYPTSNNLLIMFIRGQGVGDPAQITVDGSVGVYQDGFYLSRPQGSTFDLADLERVEILRGPQGTLYGRNTTGGAVNLISKRPSGEFGLKQKITFGSRDEFKSVTVVDLPRWNNLAVKLSVLSSTIEGYVDNQGAGVDFGIEEQLAGRLDVNWQINDALTADLLWETGNIDSSPNYYQNPAWNGLEIESLQGTNTYHADASEPRRNAYRPFDFRKSKTDYDTYGLTITWEVSDSLSIKSLTGYRELEWRAFQDFAEALGFISTTDPDFFLQPVPISFVSDNGVEGDQFSQEFTFLGSLEDLAIEYVAGLYYFEEDNDSRGFGIQSALGTMINIDRFVSARSESIAAYGQVTWTPPVAEDRLDITLGARYTEDKRQADRTLFRRMDGILDAARSQTDAANDDSYNEFNPSLTIAYDWQDNVNAYLRIATGYKAGGSSESAPVEQFSITVDPESVVSYELGVKSDWFERRLRANVAIFESQFDDMQFAFAVDPTDASIVQSYNAGEATIRGLEADLVLQVTENFALSVQYAYLDPELDTVDALPGTIFDPTTNPSAAGTFDLGDNIADYFTIPYAPDHSVLLAADSTLYERDNLRIDLHVDYSHQSSVFAATTAGAAVPGRDILRIDSYGIFNARLAATYALGHSGILEVALWGKNVLDEEYQEQIIGLGSVAPTANQLGQVVFGYVQQATVWSEPARFGVDISYRY